MSETLTDKQRRFVEEYLVDLNGAQAAIRAGYSEKTARSIAYELLDKPHVQAAVKEAIEARSQRTEVTADRVLTELAIMGLYDPADIASQPMSGPEDIAKLPEAARRVIVGWGWDKNNNFTLKLAPKISALQLIGQHLQMFRVPVDHSITDGLADALEKARRRKNEHDARDSSAPRTVN